MRKLGLLAVVTCCLFPAPRGFSQDADVEHHPFAIGEINYFGYGGLPLDKVRTAMPWHPGDTLTYAGLKKQPVIDAVTRVVGKPPTDIGIVCCDDSKRLEVYLGLSGSTSRPVSVLAAPSGTIRLDSQGRRLYDAMGAQLASAVARGQAGEDDSLGYAVSADPALRSTNLAMRRYALRREAALVRVLESSRYPEDREAAATLLGYVQRSPRQEKALAQAVTDPDAGVRNNAVRALSVLLAARNQPPRALDPTPITRLLFSGTWTDRNKASLLLMQLTATRDPAMLATLRQQALAPLVEGGCWAGVPGHSTAFLVLLGRMAGLTEEEIGEQLKAGPEQIVSAAAPGAHCEP